MLYSSRSFSIAEAFLCLLQATRASDWSATAPPGILADTAACALASSCEEFEMLRLAFDACPTARATVRKALRPSPSWAVTRALEAMAHGETRLSP